MTQKKWVEKAKLVHGDKYDYSKVDYVNSKTKVCIICPKHGEFYINTNSHLKGYGCKKCSTKFLNKNKDYKKILREWLKQAKTIHGDKYDYSKVEYVNAKTKVCIICKKHGEFWQLPNNHLQGKGCTKCKYETFANDKKLTIEKFIEKTKLVHGNRYDYSKVEYINNSTKVCIICPEHGEFWQQPNNHLNGQGCPKCVKILDINSFIKKITEVHNNKYDYSKVNYVNSQIKVCIICPEHGEFWQTPNNHLKGKGCPHCIESNLEKIVASYLQKNNIKYEKRYKKIEWLKNKEKLELDFYLPYYNIGIECQGIQHFKPVDFTGKGKDWAFKSFKYIQNNDKIKKELCEQHDLPLYYINYNDNNIENKLQRILNLNE
jgi:hypothetical protein